MTRLILWRHGRTAWNVDGRIQGHSDVDLDEIGRAQAAAAARTLAAERPDAIVSSDLRRATDTAAELAAMTGLGVRLDARLRERYFGQWQGLTGAEASVAHPEAYARWQRGEAIAVGEVEGIDDLAKRVAAALTDAIDLVDDGTVVVVTHGGSAKYVLGEVLGWSSEVVRRIIGLENCHWTELRHDVKRGWRLSAHNVGIGR